ncbi:MAG TPA: putative nucleotidyltransferase substrate binding domain-containing protein, partial [Verrucomicrobiae bacterium]|nr:putative nucleotidyltransferase substrate binding domain-containing protein [Verrucomicrobiae bacterium]
TEDGATFVTDARLRPDGEKGLLVNTLSGYSDYYQKRAMLWEIQSLSRFRTIAGDPAMQKAFFQIARKFSNFEKPPSVAAYSPAWKGEIHRMRMRIEKERTPPGQDALAIKTGLGGLMDVEFVAQALCLENGWHQPNTLEAVAKAAEEKILSAKAAQTLADNYRKLMQVERILRRWSFAPESILPKDPAAFYRVAVRCGFEKASEFQEAVLQSRAEIRQEYNSFFNGTADKAKSSSGALSKRPERKKKLTPKP